MLGTVSWQIEFFQVFVIVHGGGGRDRLVHLVDEVKDLLLHQAAGVAAKHLGLEVEDGREDGQQSTQEDLHARKCLQSRGRGERFNEQAIS
jgi:hypothetical protein